MTDVREPAVWFPAVRCGTGADVFTETLAAQLRKRGIEAEITWLPHRAEYAPWTVPVPKPPSWANVVHVNTWLHPRFIPQNLPVLATVHHSIHDPALRPYKGWLRATYHQQWIRRVERATLQRADCVVAVSRFAAESARKVVLDRPIEVIYNGVDVGRFCPPARRTIHHPFRLLYVGSWIARKGVDMLPSIMRELGDDFELRYTGGPAAKRDRTNMPPNAHDIGRLDGADAVATAMQDADALLFPSRSEGFGLVVAEAMACGLPVIATRGSSLVDVIKDGTTGVLCTRGDVRAFVAAAVALRRDARGREAMSTAALESARRRFSEGDMVTSHLACYRRLLAG